MRSEEFDKDIRSLINQREIQPAPESWDRLQQMLEESDSPKPAIRAWWYVAASVLIAVCAGAAVLLSEPVQIPDNTITETPVKKEAIEQHQQELKKSATGIAEADQHEKDAPVNDEVIISSGSVQEGMAVNKAVRPRVAVVAGDLGSKELKWISSPVREETVNDRDREIDALLANARATLENEDSGSAHRVSAELLLADVEEELDQNFKDKALEALKNGFVKLRTAVAERNQ